MNMRADDPWVVGISVAANGFTILGFAVTLLTLGTFLYQYYERKRGPRFKVGAPPTSREAADKAIPDQVVGAWTSVLNFVHNERSLAKPVPRRELSLDDELRLERELRREPFRYRRVYVDDDGRGELPIVVENSGHKRAASYYLGIIMRDAGVHLCDVISEYLKINTLFVHDPARFSTRDGVRPVSPEIIAHYDDYMYRLIERKRADLRYRTGDKQYGDLVYLDGSLDGEMYEMVLLKLQFEPWVQHFSVAFRLGWYDNLISEGKSTLALQAFEVCNASTGQPRGASAETNQPAAAPS